MIFVLDEKSMKKEPYNYPCIHKINHSLDNANNW